MESKVAKCKLCGGRVTQGFSLIKDGRVHEPIDRKYYWADEKCERPRKKIVEEEDKKLLSPESGSW